MDNEENKNGQTTGTSIPSNIDPTLDETQQKAFSKYLDPSRSAMKEKAGGLDYINGAAKTGQKGAEALEKVKVPKYTPITYKMLQNDPEVRAATPSLIRNAIFKGLEGALSTKASGRQFDPTTRMGQYDDAELQRYTENATDKENTIYQAQKQPIENAISAEAQAGIQKEDAALNSYIQDYTAEKDQDRKFALLNQVMGQAGLVQKDDNGNVLTDENGNPVFKAWEDLETPDLLKLNQLMQYLSGDTSVMNLLVGQYGPDIVEKLEGIFQEFKNAGGFGNWLKNLITGNGPVTTNPNPATSDVATALTPKYTPEQIKEGLAANTSDVVMYKAQRCVDLGNGELYDVSDTSDETLQKLSKYLATERVEGRLTAGQYADILTQIEKKTKSLTDGNTAKLARSKISLMTDNVYNPMAANKKGSQDIEKALGLLRKDRNKTSTTVDTEALKQQIQESGYYTDEQKQSLVEEIDGIAKDISLNKGTSDAKARQALQEEDVNKRVKSTNKTLNAKKGLIVKDAATFQPLDYANPSKLSKGKATYENALAEAESLFNALKETKEPLQVVKETDAGKRLFNVAKNALDGGVFAEQDKQNEGKLANYINALGDFEQWE